jgi:sigma-B regulation protein RsbU (phosphoserine phosphatase)
VLRLRIEPREGEVFVRDLAGESLVLGRSTKADVVLSDRFLSRLHARLSARGGDWVLEDLGSRNTTFLNDRPVEGPTVVRAGDVIRLAESRVTVEDPAAPRADDGLVAGDLPGSTILRPASALLAPERDRGGEPSRIAARLRVLNEVHRRLASPITLDGLLELILESAFAHLRPDQGAVFLRRPDGTFERAASRRAPGAPADLVYSRRLAQEVTEKGVAALVADASLDERFAASESLLVSGARSLIAAPLLDDEGSLGMIALGAQRQRPFDEADLELLAALASAAALRLRNIALAEETARRRLLDRELELAHDIQMAMLPRAFPDRPEIEIAAQVKPARSVGGDLYDVLADGDRVWLMIGDVSGKGVGAALFMAVTKTLFRAVAPGAPAVAAAVARMNAELSRDNDRAMFVTAFVARLDLGTGQLEYVNAGHNPPYRLEPGGRLSIVDGRAGPALGAVDGHAYGEATLCLGRGETLVLYTDGVLEARGAHEQEFGADGLETHLAASRDLRPADLVDGLLARIEEFAGDVPQYDDVTVLVARYAGSVLK